MNWVIVVYYVVRLVVIIWDFFVLFDFFCFYCYFDRCYLWYNEIWGRFLLFYFFVVLLVKFMVLLILKFFDFIFVDMELLNYFKGIY